MIYTGEIIKGHGRGKRIGFPTFNLRIPDHLAIDHGVYSAWVWIEDKRYMGALHFGPVPTFNESAATLEIFVLDYAQHEPKQTLRFEIKHFIRDIKHFDTTQALHDEIENDVMQVRAGLADKETMGI